MHLFYQPRLQEPFFQLTDEEFHHCIQVLRHQVGDEILVTNGKGSTVKASIKAITKKTCELEIMEKIEIAPKPFSIHLAIAPTKQMERMEWMVEKLCEMGVDRITFITTQNSERKELKTDRLIKKAISALKQSKGAWITQIDENLVSLKQLIQHDQSDIKLLAFVDATAAHFAQYLTANKTVCLLIGPEGDFTLEEIKKAKESGYLTVSLGTKILRTETAGLYVCSAVNLLNQY